MFIYVLIKNENERMRTRVGNLNNLYDFISIDNVLV